MPDRSWPGKPTAALSTAGSQGGSGKYASVTTKPSKDYKKVSNNRRARRNRTKAERLSKKFFRICSWNCSSSRKRISTIEKLAFDFDVLCLQETRSSKDKPINLDNFLVFQKHEGRGLAMILKGNLKNKVSMIDLEKWCSSTCELMGVRLERPDGNQKSLLLINAYVHPGAHTSKADWSFLEEIENELGDSTILCGDLNARSKIWDQQGTNSQGLALEEMIGDILLSPLAPQSPTHMGTRQGDSDTVIDISLISQKFVATMTAEALLPHGSDHNPVVFSLQKPNKTIEPKLKDSFLYKNDETDIIGKLRSQRQKTNGASAVPVTQPPWWNKDTETAWNEKRESVKLWQREKDKPSPDVQLKTQMQEKTETFKIVAQESKDKKWEQFCETLSFDTTLRQFWQFYQRMEGKNNTSFTPDMIDTNGIRLKTNEEKGSALLKRFIQQSDQKNLEEKKKYITKLEQIIVKTGLDDEITLHEFNEALANCPSGSAPGPDKVRYSDIGLLSEECKTKLFHHYKKSFDRGHVPEDWTHSYLKPLPKQGKDNRQLNGYRILTMQNIIGKLMERVVAKKLARDLEFRQILPSNQGGYRSGKCTWENAAAFAYDVYEGFQRKEETLAVAIDLEDAYNKVQFTLLMELLLTYGVSNTMTRWIAAALQERTVVLRLGDWTSEPHTVSMGLPQGSPLSPVLYNVYTKGLADINKNGIARVLTLADDGLIYKTAKDAQDRATAIQKQLDNIAEWCRETDSSINPTKAQTLLCTLNNKHANQAASPVFFNGTQIDQTDNLRYLGIGFDRMLTFRKHVENIVLKCKKSLSAMKAMAAKGIEQRLIFRLYQAVVVSVIEYGLGLTTLSQTTILKLERIQNEAMRLILGTTKDTPIETMRYLLDLPSMQARHKIEQVKAYFRALENPKNPLHEAVKDTKGNRLARGKSWMGQAEDTIRLVCPLTELRQTKEWERWNENFRHLYQTLVSPDLGRHCREWPDGRTNAEIHLILEANSKEDDIIIYTDGSVTNTQSGWGFTAKKKGKTIHEENAAYEFTTSSLTMEVEAVTHALQWLSSIDVSQNQNAVILTDSMNLLQKVECGMGSPDWHEAMRSLQLKKLTWMYCPGHAGVKGNERADRLAGRGTVIGGLKLGRSDVIRSLRKHLQEQERGHHTIDHLVDKNIKRGSGRKSILKGKARSIINQTSIGVVSKPTLQRLLKNG
ncbi:MAG: endonuclease/exonuclease/phosphatase family protein, partial [Ekhidna sp.]|nr:endonuclease/exonuclease/phosphatase family protein [Ekhidna sp.]